MVCGLNAGLTLIRETFNFWTPTYLHEVGGLDPGTAAQASLAFPLVGAASAVAAGALSTRCKGQHWRVLIPALVALTALLAFLAFAPLQGQPLAAVAVLALTAFALIGPYSFCSGAMALDFGGKRGGATAAGLIDGAGYLSAVASGFGVGALAERFGWPTAFGALAVVAGLTLLCGLAYARGERRRGDERERSMKVVDSIFELFKERGDAAYLGEAVTQTAHALQSAHAAERAGAPTAQVAAALLHDLGHLLPPEFDSSAPAGDDSHEERAARWLSPFFPSAVTEPIRLHVAAKRYLVATEPSYAAGLSEASRDSLARQGGPMTAAEQEQFRRGPWAEAALALRRWDEAAKVPGLATPDLEHSRPHLEACLEQSRD
jgi:phosphonate degradation associated HDIG domain protein